MKIKIVIHQIKDPLLWIAVALGSLAFFMVIGPSAFSPRDIGWIQGIDPIQHYLSWVFFSQDRWHFPLGLNPNYGLEISSSIVFSDVIPLMALLIKPFATLLGEPFQYFGIWVWICFVLQAWIAIRLVAIFSDDRRLQILAACLFVFSPPMLWRIGIHMAFVSHFLILAALYLNFSSRQISRTKYWLILSIFTVLVQFYILVMVLALWLADVLDRLWIAKSLSIKKALLEAILIFCTIILVAWITGYFVVESTAFGAEGHYGLHPFDFLSLFGSRNWSYILPDITSANHTYEGFMYLGLGSILAGIFAIIGLLKCPNQVLTSLLRYRFLVLILLALMLFSFTNYFVLGPWKLFFPLTDFWYQNLSMLRMSARMFWPAFYVLVLAFIYLVVKNYSRRIALIIILICSSLQIIDTSAGWKLIRTKMMMNPIVTETYQYPPLGGSPLQNPFWEEAAHHYSHIMRVPLSTNAPWQEQWSIFSAYAAKYHLATNDIYLSRTDPSQVKIANQRFLKTLLSQQLNPHNLYILDDWIAPLVKPYLNASQDALLQIDGITVLAPSLGACQACSKNLDIYRWQGQSKPIELDQPILFSKGQGGSFWIADHFVFPESWGTWAIGANTQLVLPLPKFERNKPPKVLRLIIQPFTNKLHPEQKIRVALNGNNQQNLNFRSSAQSEILIPLTAEDLNHAFLQLDFEFLNPIRPKDIGMGNDDRRLSIGLISATFH